MAPIQHGRHLPTHNFKEHPHPAIIVEAVELADHIGKWPAKMRTR